MLTIQGALRWDVVRRLLPPTGSVLEIGCGQGAMGALIARDHEYLGLEPDAASFAVARSRLGNRVRQATDQEVEGVYDIVCAFEVLEHLEDDRAALERWHDLLRPGGLLLVSVPAHRRMYGASDRRVGHVRRYDHDDLRAVLSRAGFTAPADLRTYMFPIGYPLHWARGRLARGQEGAPERGTASSGRWLQPSSRTAFARRAVAAPFAVVQRPFARTRLGTGIVAAARR